MNFKQTITITFGPVAENQVGMEQIGEDVEHGFTPEYLRRVQEMSINAGYEAEYYDLTSNLPREIQDEFQTKNINCDAAIVIIRNGVSMMMQDTGHGPNELWEEQLQLIPDKKYWDNRRGKVLNKRARYNLCFSTFSQQADFDNKKGTVVCFDDLPHLKHFRSSLGYVFGPLAQNLNAEGNYYYDPKKSKIMWHGDAERKIVIAFRLGESFPLHYQWFYQTNPVGEMVKMILNHGDLYIMSEKATGYDWKRRVIPTLRHAAGREENIKIKNRK